LPGATGNYQINRNVRDLCTFARQNITADPPFSRLDLISCRNVLIYLSPQLHRRCIPQFHYALTPGGYLILGPAESVGLYEKLFEPVDRKNRIYAKKNVPTPRLVDLVSYRGYEFPETLMNEELETAKEELQSTNEELTTLNDELSNRNLEMMQLTSDLDNLLTSVQIPIVMVDRALMVRRATPTARNAFNILPTDIGRRITDLRPNIDIPDLENILRDVTETLNVRERKVRDLQGREHSLRVRPYRTIDNKIDGAVITLVELGAKK